MTSKIHAGDEKKRLQPSPETGVSRTVRRKRIFFRFFAAIFLAFWGNDAIFTLCMHLTGREFRYPDLRFGTAEQVRRVRLEHDRQAADGCPEFLPVLKTRKVQMKARSLKRWRNSFAGRTLRRFFGEEKGAVMMEYVIVAVLIAAACVVAVAMFGKTIVGMFDVAAKGASGDHSGAKTSLDQTQQKQSEDASKASEFHDSMHK